MGQLFTVLKSDSIITVNVGARDEEVSITRAYLVALVDSGIVYPRTKSVLQKEITAAQIVISYTCVEHNCSYESALKEITNGEKAAELKALGVHELTKEIVSVISSNPKIFPSSGMDGYIFQAVGMPYLYVRNDSVSTEPKNRAGFLDLSDVRKKLIFKSMRKKEAKSRMEEVGMGVLLGFTLLQGGQWLMKLRK